MFLKRPSLKIGKKYFWVLDSELHYETESGFVIIVPEGFETDLASIPRIFTRVLPINDDHRLAAIVHDYLYCKQGKIGNKNFTRKASDKIFKSAMKKLGLPGWKIFLMYRAVRIGGFVGWGQASKDHLSLGG